MIKSVLTFLLLSILVSGQTYYENAFEMNEITTLPQRISKKNLEYPPEMIKLGIEGIAQMKFLIDEYGHVIDAYPVRDAHDEFISMATDYLYNTKWKPGERDGKVVKTWAELPFVFLMNDGLMKDAYDNLRENIKEAFEEYNDSDYEDVIELMEENIEDYKDFEIKCGQLALEADSKDNDRTAADYRLKPFYLKRDIGESFEILGNVYLSKLDDMQKAEECFKSAVSYSQFLPTSWANLGWIYYLNGDYDNSISCSKKAIQVLPTTANPRFNIALANLAAGKYEIAEKYYNNAILHVQSRGISIPEGNKQDVIDLIQKGLHVEKAKEILVRYFQMSNEEIDSLIADN